MLLDWKYPKYLEPLVLEVQKDYWVDNKKARSGNQATDQALSCLLLNMTHALAFGRKDLYIPLNSSVYSDPLVYNGVHVSRNVSYRGMLRVLEWMQDSGRVGIIKGGVSSWSWDGSKAIPKDKTMTQLIMSEYLVNQILPYAEKKRLNLAPSVIELRGADGKPVVAELGEYQRDIKDLLERYNFLARNRSITMKGQSYDIQLKKVYNMTWENGGRNYLYRDAQMYSECLRRENRGEILLDGEPTVELDFRSLHISMIYEMEGIKLPSDYDPYAIHLDGWSDVGARWAGKLCSLVLINAGTGRKGMGGLQQAMKEDSRFEGYRGNGDVPKVIKYREIFDAILDRNPILCNYALEPVGLTLQNMDSLIMDAVLGELYFIDELGLPLHDGLVVKARLEDFVRDKMYLAYEAVMGSAHNCVVSKR
jgi:hypothetical protein